MMPSIGQIRRVNNHYGYQVIRMANGGRRVKAGAPHYTKWVPGIQRGYVKVWKAGPPAEVVDRALTVGRAREIIRKLMKEGVA